MIVRELGLCDYARVWRDMSAFTDARDTETEDELWLLQHHPVYTLGKNGKSEHILDAGDIPVINSDRGGQVTYHGPGQLVAYVLMDIQRRKIGVRELVSRLEQSVIDMLGEYGIASAARADAPGVYVGDAKIAALGLRVRRGRSFHGLALNIDVDLQPFRQINPCGYPGMAVTRLADLTEQADFVLAQRRLCDSLLRRLSC